MVNQGYDQWKVNNGNILFTFLEMRFNKQQLERKNVFMICQDFSRAAENFLRFNKISTSSDQDLL